MVKYYYYLFAILTSVIFEAFSISKSFSHFTIFVELFVLSSRCIAVRISNRTSSGDRWNICWISIAVKNIKLNSCIVKWIELLLKSALRESVRSISECLSNATFCCGRDSRSRRRFRWRQVCSPRRCCFRFQ